MSPQTLTFPLLLTLATLVGSAVQPEKPSEANGLTYSLQVVGPEPLPFQAVRLRLSARNQSSNDHGPIQDLYGAADSVRFTRSSVSHLPRGDLRTAWPFDPAMQYQFRRTGPLWYSYTMNNRGKLRTSEQISLSWVHCGDFLMPGTRYPVEPQLVLMKPLFPEAGTYQIECRMPPNLLGGGTKETDTVRVPAKITVREPQGDDKVIYEMLKKDVELASNLLWPVNVPASNQLHKLLALIQAYPKSSYTPYAKFALARYYYARKDRKEDAEQAIRILRDLLEPERPDFPFEPYAIAALIELDPASHAEFIPLMDQEYCDAVEWLDEFRYGDKSRIAPWLAAVPQRPRTPDEKVKNPLTWAEYRKRVPYDRWAKPAEKK